MTGVGSTVGACIGCSNVREIRISHFPDVAGILLGSKVGADVGLALDRQSVRALDQETG
jgi:hypothetical protein